MFWPFFPKNRFLKVFKGVLLLLAKCLGIEFGFENPTVGCIFCPEYFQNEREIVLFLKKLLIYVILELPFLINLGFKSGFFFFWYYLEIILAMCCVS